MKQQKFSMKNDFNKTEEDEQDNNKYESLKNLNNCHDNNNINNKMTEKILVDYI